MAKYAPVIYATPEALKTALEAIDTTTAVQVIPFQENQKQKFMLLK